MDVTSPVLQHLSTICYIISYLAVAGIGLFQLITPSPVVQAEAGSITYVWAGMLIVGGLVAAVGYAGSWWVPELAAQAFVAFPFLLWGYAVVTSDNPVRWSFTCLCLMVIARAVGRAFRLVMGVRKQAPQ